LEEMLKLLDTAGVEVRSEPLGGGGGGLCKVKGQWMFFLDTQSSAADAAALCAEAVCKAVDLENIYIRPEVRDYIEVHAERQ